MTSVAEQIQWGLDYIQRRYGDGGSETPAPPAPPPPPTPPAPPQPYPL